MSNDLAFAGALEQRRRIAARDVSPRELVELYCERIERLDGRVRSYLTVTREGALRAARAAEDAVMRGDPLGPLHGVPVSIKDTEDTRGVRTTKGSLIFRDRVPGADALPVERILGAGAIMLGKTNCPEFGLIGDTTNRLGDPCRNPWNTDRSPGGSTGGGAAALAAGLCALSQGSDGGGSLRGPASFCGVYGIKATLGRVARHAGPGVPTPVNHFSQHGPLARTVRDAALMLQVLAGWDARDPNALRTRPDDYLAAAERGVSGVRFGWNPDFGGFPVDSEVQAIAARAALAFEEVGGSVEHFDITLDTPAETFWTLQCANAYAGHGALYEAHADLMMPYTRHKLEAGRRVTGADYVRALGRMGEIRATFLDKFERFDLLLNPTTAVPAFPAGRPTTEIEGRAVDEFEGYNPFNFHANMIGHPAASVPCGFTAAGLPVGLQIIGRFGDDAGVIAASAAFEMARPWAHHRPPEPCATPSASRA